MAWRSGASPHLGMENLRLGNEAKTGKSDGKNISSEKSAAGEIMAAKKSTKSDWATEVESSLPLTGNVNMEAKTGETSGRPKFTSIERKAWSLVADREKYPDFPDLSAITSLEEKEKLAKAYWKRRSRITQKAKKKEKVATAPSGKEKQKRKHSATSSVSNSASKQVPPPSKRRDIKTTPLAKTSSSATSASAKVSSAKGGRTFAQVAALTKYSLQVFGTRDQKKRIKSEDFQALMGKLSQTWISGRKGAFNPNILDSYFTAGKGIINCCDVETQTWAMGEIAKADCNGQTFRGWRRAEEDGYIQASVLLPSFTKAVGPLEFIRKALDNVSLEGEVEVTGDFDTPSGKVARLSLSGELAKAIHAREDKVQAGWITLVFRFKELNVDEEENSEKDLIDISEETEAVEAEVKS